MNSALVHTRFTTVALGLFWIAGMPFLFWEASDLMSPRSTVYLATTLGNTIVFASTAAYIANVYLRCAGVARWATRLAALGAVVLALSVVFGFAEGGTPISIWRGFPDYYGMLSTLVPILVIWHLFMDHIERNAVISASIMILATGIIVGEIWLLREAAGAGGISAEAFGYYWRLAHLVAQVIGYAAFGLATLAGMSYLVGLHLQAADLACRWPAGRISHRHLQTCLATAAGVGAPVFVAAILTVLGCEFNFGVRHEGFWAAALFSGVMILYTAFLARLLKRQFKAPEAAWWVIGGLVTNLAVNVGLIIFTDFISNYAS